MEKELPDVIIMDLKMPIMDGMEATKVVRKKEIGANGYLLKNTDSDEIRKSIYAVHENGYYFNDLVNKALLKKLIIKGNLKPSFNSNIDLAERTGSVEIDLRRENCSRNW